MSEATKKKHTISETFRLACGDRGRSRYSNDTPFVQSNHIYATNGRIAVRRGLDQTARDFSPQSEPEASRLGWEELDDDSLPKISIPDLKFKAEECIECCGLGATACSECGAERECSCGGADMILVSKSYPIGGPDLHIDGMYLWWAKMAGAGWLVKGVRRPGQYYFRTSECEGTLMGLHVPDPKIMHGDSPLAREILKTITGD